MVAAKSKVTLDSRLEASDDSDDEDYDPVASTKKADNDEEDSGKEDELGAYDSGDEKTVDKAVSKGDNEASHEIKTRSQRAQEVEKSSLAPKQSTTNVDDIWSAMNAPKAKETKQSAEEDMIEIDRIYMFAGERQTERKIVSRHSQEGKDYLASLAAAASASSPNNTESPDERQDIDKKQDAIKTRVNESGKPLRKIYKRKSTLVDDKPRKLNTLEKSRMEWSGFVDREGINEDLKRGNQAGYLDKVDFLRESEAKKYSNFKDGQRKVQK